MNRLFQFLGIGTFVFGIGYGILYLKSNNDIFNEALRIFGLLALVILIGYVVARIIWGKNWVVKGGANTIVGGDLVASIQQFTQELPAPSKEATASLVGNIIYRFTRIGVFAMLITLIPLALLWKQNQLLNNQNEMFSFQNEKIDVQINLTESNRRSSLVLMMSNIMDKIDEELRNDWQRDSLRNLSPQLIGRISALSYSLKPYRFLEEDSLIAKPYSPERGQLLLALVGSNLDTVTYKRIFSNSIFEKVYLKGANLNESFLKYINLSNSYLQNTSFFKANLSNADFYNTNLENTNLSGTNLFKTSFNSSNMENTNLKGANMSYASLAGVNLQESDFGAPLPYLEEEIGLNRIGDRITSPKKVVKSPTIIRYTNFSGATLTGVNLSGLNILNSNFDHANLAYANLIETSFSFGFRMRMEGTNLKNAAVSELNLKWIERLEEVKFSRHKKFYIDTIPIPIEPLFLGRKYYLIKEEKSKD